MVAANKDLSIEQGATFRLTVTYGYRDGTLDINGEPITTPYDLTGAEAKLQIRRKPGGDVLLTASTTDGRILITDPPGGRLVITFVDEDTQALTVSRAKYDIDIAYPGGDVVRILQGKVIVSPNITVLDPAESP